MMKTWADIAGVQPLASKIITNSFKKERVSHAYLIQGERGTGKEAIALLLAKGLFCQHKQGAEPCLRCSSCKRIESGNFPDVHWIKPEGQSIKIDQIEQLQKEFVYSGLESNQKVYIIVGSDTLTTNAANRILKFLEEPSRKTTAIMLTENSQSIIPTIRSRCQVIDLKPLNPRLFQTKLIELGMTETNASLFSALTNSIDDAFSLAEDEWFTTARKISFQLIDVYLSQADDPFSFIHQKWFSHFKERDQHDRGLDLLLLLFKDFLYYQIGNEEAIVVFSKDDERLERSLQYFSQDGLLHILNLILEAKRKLKQNVNPTLVIEQLTLHIQRRE